MLVGRFALINARSTMHNAQLALDASIISKSGTLGVEKPAYAGIFGLRVGGFGQTTGTTQKQPEQLFLFFLQIG